MASPPSLEPPRFLSPSFDDFRGIASWTVIWAIADMEAHHDARVIQVADIFGM